MASNFQRWHMPLVVVALCVTCCLAGCREHPRVTSREALDLIKQVYTACNTRNAERLTRCQQELDKLKADGVLSQAELRSFETILDRARSGDWSYAQSASLQFARDQTR